MGSSVVSDGTGVMTWGGEHVQRGREKARALVRTELYLKGKSEEEEELLEKEEEEGERAKRIGKWRHGR